MQSISQQENSTEEDLFFKKCRLQYSHVKRKAHKSASIQKEAFIMNGYNNNDYNGYNGAGGYNDDL